MGQDDALVAGLIGIISAAISSVGSVCGGPDSGGANADCHATTHGRTAIIGSAIGGPTIGGPTISATAIGDGATAIGRAISQGVI